MEGESSSATSTSLSSIHLLPCKINYDGLAPVSSFFQVTQDAKTKVLTSHLRGREFRGVVIDLPREISGICATKRTSGAVEGISSSSQESTGCNNHLDIVGHFESINVWQHDSIPNENILEDYFDWFEVAKAVSFEVTFTRIPKLNNLICVLSLGSR